MAGVIIMGIAAALAPLEVDGCNERLSVDDERTVRRETDPLSLPVTPDPMDEPLVTDRPDFTESTLTVPPGHLQLESGYTFTYNRDDGVRTKSHTYPEFLLRVGMVEDLELRIVWAGWTRTEAMFQARNDAGRTVQMGDSVTGGNDLSLGIKYHIADQGDWRPDLGVIFSLDIPVGHDGYTSGDVDPFVGILWAYDLSEDWALAGNINFAMPSVGEERIFEPQSSVSLAYSISDDVGAYLEYYGLYPTSGDGADTHYVNGGFTYLITNNLQLDIRAGAGLNEDSDDFFTGAGFSWRF